MEYTNIDESGANINNVSTLEKAMLVFKKR